MISLKKLQFVIIMITI